MPLSSEIVKNSMNPALKPKDVKKSSMYHCKKEQAKRDASVALGSPGVLGSKRFRIRRFYVGAFIWQLVGVLAT